MKKFRHKLKEEESQSYMTNRIAYTYLDNLTLAQKLYRVSVIDPRISYVTQFSIHVNIRYSIAMQCGIHVGELFIVWQWHTDIRTSKVNWYCVNVESCSSLQKNQIPCNSTTSWRTAFVQNVKVFLIIPLIVWGTEVEIWIIAALEFLLVYSFL